MEYKKICFVASNTPEAQKTLNVLSNIYKNHPIYEADVIIALGGDGFMLETLHKHFEHNVPIYGINRGTVGFLLNHLESGDLFEKLANAQKVVLHPLKMVATDCHGKTTEGLAVNEVSLLRQTRQVANISIAIDGKIRMESLVCYGIMVATPAGSTAYNLSAHGPILPLESKLLALTPISPFRPRRWRGAILPHTSEVEFIINNESKRPVSAVADYTEVRDIKSVKITEDRTISLPLLFDPEHNLEERIISEQFLP